MVDGEFCRISESGNVKKLEGFYGRLREGVSVEAFLALHNGIFLQIYSAGLSANYRAGLGQFKRLRDEITPGSRFARYHLAPGDLIQFPLDDGQHDCIVSAEKSNELRTIQITVAQGKEKYWLMHELNQTGEGRGYLGLTDADEWSKFKEAISTEHRTYETSEVINTIKSALCICATKKQNSASQTLLIEADLLSLPVQRWSSFLPTFSQAIRSVEFGSIKEVFMVGRSDAGDTCFQLL